MAWKRILFQAQETIHASICQDKHFKKRRLIKSHFTCHISITKKRIFSSLFIILTAKLSEAREQELLDEG